MTFGVPVSLCLVLLLGSCGYLRDRGLDFADCFVLDVGGGVGLVADVHLTDWMSPAVGIASYTVNAGWNDRDLWGVWQESDVVNTPRWAYQWFSDEYTESSRQVLDEGSFLARFALSSLTLPNERWVRLNGRTEVEYFSLFNFGKLGERQRASMFAGLFLPEGQEPRVRTSSVWDKAVLEVGVTAAVVHARAGFNPAQLFDFLVGWFGWDPAEDDDVRHRARARRASETDVDGS